MDYLSNTSFLIARCVLLEFFKTPSLIMHGEVQMDCGIFKTGNEQQDGGQGFFVASTVLCVHGILTPMDCR